MTADVIVIGGGGAGLSAAAEAARLGRKTILLEKNPALGGSTAWSVGSISATNTPHQLKQGIHDTPDEHFEDLEALAGGYANRDNRALRRILVDNTNEMLHWLISIGLVFVGPNPEPPHRQPRMHNVLPNSRAFPDRLGRHCRSLGVDIQLNTLARRLLVEDGRVVGVVADRNGEPVEFRARGGVVIAGGDYSASAELKARYAGEDAARLEPVNPTATGDAFKLALDLGAVILNGDIVRGPIMRFVPPRRRNLLQLLPPHRWLALIMRWTFDRLPASLLRPFVMSFLTTALGPSVDLFKRGAILVNKDGRRFVNEVDKPGRAVPLQRDREAFIVIDGRMAREFSAWPYYISTAPGVAYAYLEDYRRNRKDIFHKADTIEALAASVGMPAAALADSVSSYNATGRREGVERPALTEGPYYALGPVKSYVVFTDGGLKVSERLEVLKENNDAIPGLFAAGSAGQGGLLLEGHGHHLGWGFHFGQNRRPQRGASAVVACRVESRQKDVWGENMFAQRIHGLLFVFFGLVSAFDSWRISTSVRPTATFDEVGPDRYLAILSGLMIVLGLALALRPQPAEGSGNWSDLRKWPPPEYVVVLVVLTLFIWAIPVVGFSISSLLFFVASYKLMGNWSWPRTLTYAIITTVFIYVVFVYFADMSMPRSFLGI
ncbi:MAG: FAD-dependent oxidoreductase [Pseudolabrys sp.]